MAFGQQTYNTNRRESLLEILRDVSPNVDNYLVTNLGRAPDATNTLHEWPVYYTERPTSDTNQVEGAQASYDDLTSPTRSNNYTAIKSETVRISGTQAAIDIITGEDSFEFQKREALKRLKAKMEYATINGVASAGASGVARSMAGIDGMISTNVTVRSTNTSFTEAELNNIVQDSYDAVGSDYVGDVLLCPMVIKRRIGTFSMNNTRNIDASEKKITGEIRVFDSDSGYTVKIIPHKDVNKGVGTLKTYLIREDLYKYSFLAGREPNWEELAKDGDRENGQWITEFTTVSFAQRSSVKRSGYATTL